MCVALISSNVVVSLETHEDISSEKLRRLPKVTQLEASGSGSRLQGLARCSFLRAHRSQDAIGLSLDVLSLFCSEAPLPLRSRCRQGSVPGQLLAFRASVCLCVSGGPCIWIRGQLWAPTRLAVSAAHADEAHLRNHPRPSLSLSLYIHLA